MNHRVVCSSAAKPARLLLASGDRSARFLRFLVGEHHRGLAAAVGGGLLDGGIDLGFSKALLRARARHTAIYRRRRLSQRCKTR
jgi:hypothetical protein